jgi:hypothetical protein
MFQCKIASVTKKTFNKLRKHCFTINKCHVVFEWPLRNVLNQQELICVSGGNNADSNNIDTIFTCQQSRQQQSQL